MMNDDNRAGSLITSKLKEMTIVNIFVQLSGYASA